MVEAFPLIQMKIQWIFMLHGLVLYNKRNYSNFGSQRLSRVGTKLHSPIYSTVFSHKVVFIHKVEVGCVVINNSYNLNKGPK